MRIIVIALLCLSCDAKPKGERKPTGTPTDPVEHCEKPAQTCRYQGSQLGVCVIKQSPAPEDCDGQRPCFECAPQH